MSILPRNWTFPFGSYSSYLYTWGPIMPATNQITKQDSNKVTTYPRIFIFR